MSFLLGLFREATERTAHTISSILLVSLCDCVFVNGLSFCSLLGKAPESNETPSGPNAGSLTNAHRLIFETPMLAGSKSLRRKTQLFFSLKGHTHTTAPCQVFLFCFSWDWFCASSWPRAGFSKGQHKCVSSSTCNQSESAGSDLLACPNVWPMCWFVGPKSFDQLLVLGPLGQVSVQFLSPCWGPLAGGVSRAPRTPIGFKCVPLGSPRLLCSPPPFWRIEGRTYAQEAKGPTGFSVDSLHAPLGQEKNAHQIVEERRQRKSSFDPMQVQ